MSQAARRLHWERLCARTALRINLASWLESFAPAAFTLVSAAAIAFFALRRLRQPLETTAWLMLAALAVAMAIAFWRKRKSFFGRSDARIFLEYQLGLDAALSAAQAGIAAWPSRISPLPKLLRFQTRTSFVWLGGSAALLAASLWLPVPPLPSRSIQAAEKAPALAEVEALLEELKQSDIADPASLERLQSEAQQLGNRPAEKQYSHSALEAADALRDQALAATENLARNYETATKALEEPEKQGSDLSDAAAEQAAKDLSAALKGLRDGQLGANQKLSSQLKGMDASKLRQLSKDQLSKMRSSMSKASQAARGIAGACKNPSIAKGDGEKVAVGQGGPGGGGPPAPLAFNENPSASQEGKINAVSNEDYSRAALGDALETTNGRHSVDESKTSGPQAGGSLASPGRGGEAVWVNRLTPAERAALKEFFK